MIRGIPSMMLGEATSYCVDCGKVLCENWEPVFFDNGNGLRYHGGICAMCLAECYSARFPMDRPEASDYGAAGMHMYHSHDPPD